jgi:hypothetical protein
MYFSCIYAVDCHPDNLYGAEFYKPDIGEWTETEGDDQYQKWCAILTKDEFLKWVRGNFSVGSLSETMGMLGAPGFGIGHAPAWCLTSGEEDWSGSLYFCPLIPMQRKTGEAEFYKVADRDENWKRLKRAVINMMRK